MMTRREALALLAAPAMVRGASAKVRLGFSLYGMKDIPVPEAIRTCAAIGYDGVELCLTPGWSAPGHLTPEARREIRSTLDTTGIGLLALMENLSAIERDMSETVSVDRIRKAAEVGHAILASGRPILETVLGGKSAEWDVQKNNIAGRLRAWAAAAETSGITLCVKAHAGAAVDTPEKLLWLDEQVHNPALRLTYDYSHFQMIGFSLPVTLHQIIGHCSFIHVKDVKGTGTQPQFLLAGDGTIDYAEYFKLLKSTGYSGPVVAEVSLQLQRLPGYDPQAAAKRCYETLSRGMLQAGLTRR